MPLWGHSCVESRAVATVYPWEALSMEAMSINTRPRCSVFYESYYLHILIENQPKSYWGKHPVWSESFSIVRTEQTPRCVFAVPVFA